MSKKSVALVALHANCSRKRIRANYNKAIVEFGESLSAHKL